MMRRSSASHQTGVAVITALLLTTLAVTLVAGLFWRQELAAHSLENQRMEAQMRWLLLGASDQAAMILRNDALKSNNVSYLGQTWSLPVTERHIDDYDDASLSRQIHDAQARYNLSNLVGKDAVNKTELAVFRRLLFNLQLSPSLAETVAAAVLSNGPTLQQVDDLLAIPSITPATVERLRDYVVILPASTPVNLNTATAPVFAACFEDMTTAEATSLLASRSIAYFRDAADFAGRVNGNRSTSANTKPVAFSSQFFLIDTHLRIGRTTRHAISLLKRDANQSVVLWTRES